MLKPPVVPKPYTCHFSTSERAPGQRKGSSVLFSGSQIPLLKWYTSASDEGCTARKRRQPSLIPFCVPESVTQLNDKSVEANENKDPNAKSRSNQQDEQAPLQSVAQGTEQEVEGKIAPAQDGPKSSSDKDKVPPSGASDAEGSKEASASKEATAPNGESGKKASTDSENENRPMTGSMLVPASPMMQSRPAMPSAPATCSLKQPDGCNVVGTEGSVSMTPLGENHGVVPPLSLYGDLAVYMFEGPTPPMTSMETERSPLRPLVPLIVEPPVIPSVETTSEPCQMTAGSPAAAPGAPQLGSGTEVAGDVGTGGPSGSSPDMSLADPHTSSEDWDEDQGPVPQTNWLRLTGPLEHVAPEAALTTLTSPDLVQEPVSDIQAGQPLSAAASTPVTSEALQHREAHEHPSDGSTAIDSAESDVFASATTSPPSFAGPPAAAQTSDTVLSDGNPAMMAPSTDVERADAVASVDKGVGGSTETVSTSTSSPPSSTATVAGGGLIHPFHIMLFGFLAAAFSIACIAILNYTTEMGWMWSSMRVLSRVSKGLAFRQCIALLAAMAFVRYGLEPFVKAVRTFFMPGEWERSSEFFVLQQLYRPLEFLLAVSAFATIAENLLPPLIAFEKEAVRQVVRNLLSLTYVIAFTQVLFNIKKRIVKERLWKAETEGNVSMQRSIEVYDKLLSLLITFVCVVLCVQAIGLEVKSLLTISGFGGLAIGLAGREILENLFSGLLILSSRSFEVGEEIMFTQAGHAGRVIEGIVMEIGWYRTLIRSFEREVYVVPNSVFSRTVVLNVTRKGKEWRVFERIGIRVDDVDAVPDIIQDMREIIREDARVLPKLHRRVYLDRVERDELTVYISFYIEAANRDAFMATRQDIFMSFSQSCRKRGAQLANNRRQVQITASSVLQPEPLRLSDRNSDLDGLRHMGAGEGE